MKNSNEKDDVIRAHKYSSNHSSTQLNETTCQLATFIAKTGFNNVTWRNIPVLNEVEGVQGPRRVALINLKHMHNSVNGFTGDVNGSCGLIGCVTEEQMAPVIAEASRNGIDTTSSSSDYREIGLPQDCFFANDEMLKQRWLDRIIQALVDKGHIFKLVQEHDSGYVVQA